MDPSFHQLPELFAQLGLPNDERPLSEHPCAAETERQAGRCAFWSPAQAALREELLEGADRAQVVDQLNVALRKPR